MEISKIKNFLLDVFFPKFCFGCQREGSYLCPDCKSVLDISGFHLENKTKNLEDLYFALEYRAPLTKKLVQKFKYEPFAREIASDLASLIIEHFQQLEKAPAFLKEKGGTLIVPIPLEKRRLRWRGFNQAEEIGKVLSKFLEIPLLSSLLFKIKETPPQIVLSGRERKENVKGTFLVKNKGLAENKKILLIDDVYTTGSTMEEAAKVLKEAGAKEIVGIAFARAEPTEDSL